VFTSMRRASGSSQLPHVSDRFLLTVSQIPTARTQACRASWMCASSRIPLIIRLLTPKASFRCSLQVDSSSPSHPFRSTTTNIVFWYRQYPHRPPEFWLCCICRLIPCRFFFWSLMYSTQSNSFHASPPQYRFRPGLDSSDLTQVYPIGQSSHELDSSSQIVSMLHEPTIYEMAFPFLFNCFFLVLGVSASRTFSFPYYL
jgi:hypothetical protein